MLVGASCTAELIQDDPGGLARALACRSRWSARAALLPEEGELGRGRDLLPARARARGPHAPPPGRARAARAPASARAATCSARPRSASATATTCARSRKAARAARRRRQRVAPLGATPADSRASARPTSTSCSIPRSRGRRAMAGAQFGQPMTKTVPIGVGATRDFIARSRRSPASTRARSTPRRTGRACPGTRARSTRPTSPASASSSSATRRTPSPPRASPARNSGFEVVGLGTYSREFAREVREAAKRYGVEALITDDYLEVEAGSPNCSRAGARHADGAPHRQAARHALRGDLGAGARAGLPGALLAADGLRGRERAVRHLGPPADDGPRGASARMFRDDFEFHDGAAALAPRAWRRPCAAAPAAGAGESRPRCADRRARRARRRRGATARPSWAPRAEKELKKIPFFVRGKARRNTERFAAERGVATSPSRRSTMPKRTSAADATPVRVVIVTMDSHLASAVDARARRRCGASCRAALTRARGRRVGRRPGRAGALPRRHRARRHRHRDDAVHGGPHPRRAAGAAGAARHCDAMVCCMSAGEVVKLTRSAASTWTAPRRAADGAAEALRGKKEGSGAAGGPDEDAAPLPQILRFIPGTAQDVRAYFLTLQYWLAGSEENIANMVRLLVDRYADGPRAAARHAEGRAPGRVPGGRRLPPAHARPDRRARGRAARPPAGRRSGTVGLLLMRSYLLAGNTAHYDGVIAALEARGLRVVPAFASGLDARPAIERFFMRDGRADGRRRGVADRLLAGRRPGLQRRARGRGDARRARRALPRRASGRVPDARAVGRVRARPDAGRGDDDGRDPRARRRDRPDGVRRPLRSGGHALHRAATGCTFREACARHAVRIERARCWPRASRGWSRCAARARRAQGRVVLFNFPPNAGNTGTAAYLGVRVAVQHAARRCARGGYTVDVPESVDALRERILEGNAARFGADANVHARIPADDHVRASAGCRDRGAVGPGARPPAERRRVDPRARRALRQRLRRRAAGFGYEGDPMRLLFERGLRADARLLGLLPLAARGLRRRTRCCISARTARSSSCRASRPACRRLLARPADRRPAELLPLRREQPVRGHDRQARAAATLISYLTPPVAHAGLYRGLLDLKASLDRWRALEPRRDARARARDARRADPGAGRRGRPRAAEPAWARGRRARIAAARDAPCSNSNTR
jgi:hypothetical protein